MREPITDSNSKPCAGCGEDKHIDSFIDKRNDEQAYCASCRKPCPVCTDWIGACGGCEEMGLEPRRVA